MNLPFNIKFTIFDENKPISKTQEKLKETIIQENLRDIIKELFNADDNFKFLDRAEASVCSIDENKQLRLGLDTNNLKNINTPCIFIKNTLHFHQKHSGFKEYFTIEELKYISYKIKNGLEEFLHYEIDEPIIYINIDEL